MFCPLQQEEEIVVNKASTPSRISRVKTPTSVDISGVKQRAQRAKSTNEKQRKKQVDQESLDSITFEIPGIRKQVTVDPEEEKLRQILEAEDKRKKLLDEKKKKYMNNQEESHKLQKTNVVNMKAGEFTFDHQGNIIPIKNCNIEKLPPISLKAVYTFKDPQPPQLLKPKPPEEVKDTKQVRQAFKKSKPIQEQKPQSSVFDKIQLSAGVKLKEGGQSKEGPDILPCNRMSRNEYLRMQGVQTARGDYEREIQMMQSISKVESIRPETTMGITISHTGKEVQKSQVDEFNIEILSNVDWGNNPAPQNVRKRKFYQKVQTPERNRPGTNPRLRRYIAVK